MVKPKRTSALAGLLAEDKPNTNNPGVRLRSVEDGFKFTLRGSEDVAKKAASALDLTFASDMLSFQGDETKRMTRLGPNEWLIVQNQPPELGDALAGTHHALVDVSERTLSIWLDGQNAKEALAGGCPLDLDEERVTAGFATRTLLGKAEIILECFGDQRFALHTNRSFLEYAWLMLLETGREYGVSAS